MNSLNYFTWSQPDRQLNCQGILKWRFITWAAQAAKVMPPGIQKV